MTRATITHTKTPRRAHPAVLRAALRSHNRNDTESGRVAAQQRGTHRPTPCGYNRLIEVHDASNAIIATYRYDPFGRRLSKTANNQSTYYFYSAEGLIAEADSNGQIIQSYGYAPGSTFTTNPLWTKLSTAGTATYYTYQNDHLGTPQKLLNQSGLTVWSATYDAFGRATIDPASTISNNLRFPGQYFDAETTLHYNWNRYYDPTVGRYTTSDPIGLLGGDNIFAYVVGNPLGNTDPDGDVVQVVGALIGGFGNLAYQLYMNNGNLSCVNPWEVANWALMGTGVGMLSGGARIGFFRNSQKHFSSISQKYFGRGMANGRSLDHVFITQSLGRKLGIPESIINGGWNLVVMPEKLNRFIGGFVPKGMKKNFAMKAAMTMGRAIATSIPVVAGTAAGVTGYISGTLAQEPKAVTNNGCECK